MSVFTRLFATAGAATLATVLAIAPSHANGEVNVYSYRTPGLIQPLIDAFEKESGIKVNVINAKGLVERISTEGANSPADVLLTVDIGRLDGAVQTGITAPYISDTITENVPAEFRDPDGHWTGLTLRGRVVYASKERFEGDSINYADLTDPEYKGKVCTRSGQHVYSIGLFASILAHEGEDATRSFLEGLKANLARKPEGNDRAQAKAIHEGLCDLALANTYYMGLMLTNEKNPEQKEWASSIKVIYPNQDGRGTHMNVAGVSLIKTAPNADNAKAFIDFLASDEGQKLYAEQVFEFPVDTTIEPSDVVKSFSPAEIKRDSLSLAEVAGQRKRASELVDEVGLDN